MSNFRLVAEKCKEGKELILKDVFNKDFVAFLETKSESLLKDELKALFQNKIFKKVRYLDAITTDSSAFILTNIYKTFSKGTGVYHDKLIDISEIDANIEVVNHDNDSTIRLVDFLVAQKGKVVYLDFWTTWCSPCIRNIPNSNDLQEVTKDKDIVYVNICLGLDKEMKKWKLLIENTEWQGTNLFYKASGTVDSPLKNLFSFFGFPSYRVVNKFGFGVARASKGPPAIRYILEKLAEQEYVK